MSLPREALDLFPFTVELRALAGHDEYGQAVYAAPEAVRALVTGRRRLVRDAAGQEIVSEATIYLASNQAVTPGSLLRLPDGEERRVLSVSRDPDEFGWFITTLYL
jgi:hypothetical protein